MKINLKLFEYPANKQTNRRWKQNPEPPDCSLEEEDDKKEEEEEEQEEEKDEDEDEKEEKEKEEHSRVKCTTFR